MIRELKEIDKNDLLGFDVCIIGSGPAGITLALKLEKAGKRVALLEAGSYGENSITKALKQGNKSTGQWYNIEGSRLVQLGGTSGHWAGYCAELDKEDYYLNGLGEDKWPFGYEELQPFDKEAAEILELGENSNPKGKSKELIEFKDTFHEKVWRFSTPVRFGEKYKQALEKSEVEVFIGALVYKILFDQIENSRVSSVQVYDENKRNVIFKAKQFVLCQGAIETTRMLLQNSEELSKRMGNGFSFVGRYFADHPHLLNVGTALLFGKNAKSDRYRLFKLEGRAYASFFQIKPKIREQLGLNNFVIRLEWNQEEDEYTRALTGFLRKKGKLKDDVRIASVSFMGEQLPNFESYIKLLPEKNDFGINAFQFNWRSTEQDFSAMRKTLELFGQKLGENGIGRLMLNEKYHKENLTKQMYGGNHHLGTTRMGKSENDSATDLNGKLWGLENVYVCGSALFPTYGSANPTYNIVRLALRLSSHLLSNEK